jgi:phage tail-like protein
MAAPGEQKATYPIQYWRLTADGLEGDALFLTAQLPTLTLNNAELRHVGADSLPQATKVAVNHTWGDLSFQRGIDDKTQIWEWIKQGLPQEGGGGGKIEKKQITVELCGGEDHKTTIQKWVYEGAWPSTYTPPQLNANSGEIAMESITFTFDTGDLTK